MQLPGIRGQLKQATSFLIMQLASDRIRQVVVRPACYLATHQLGLLSGSEKTPDPQKMPEQNQRVAKSNGDETVPLSKTKNGTCHQSFLNVASAQPTGPGGRRSSIGGSCEKTTLIPDPGSSASTGTQAPYSLPIKVECFLTYSSSTFAGQRAAQSGQSAAATRFRTRRRDLP